MPPCGEPERPRTLSLQLALRPAQYLVSFKVGAPRFGLQSSFFVRIALVSLLYCFILLSLKGGPWIQRGSKARAYLYEGLLAYVATILGLTSTKAASSECEMKAKYEDSTDECQSLARL